MAHQQSQPPPVFGVAWRRHCRAVRDVCARAATTLTIASLFGADKPETKIWVRIKEIVDAQLPGRFDFRIVGNAALGGEKEVAEGIRLGSVQGQPLDHLRLVELGS